MLGLLSDGLLPQLKYSEIQKSDAKLHSATAQLGLINPTLQTACGFVGFIHPTYPLGLLSDGLLSQLK